MTLISVDITGASMELPIPTLTTSQTIWVVFLCFVAVQIFLALSKRQREKEARDAFMSKMAVHEVSLVDYPAEASSQQQYVSVPGDWTPEQVEQFKDYFDAQLRGSASEDDDFDGNPSLRATPEQNAAAAASKAKARARFAIEAPSQPKCPTPPNGWDCSRDIGHPGPCAASPSKGSASEGGAS